MSNEVKVFFALEQDEDSYPPVSAESIWAAPTDASDEYTLSNTPFFVKAVTLGDTVRATRSNGQLWFNELTKRSDNSLIRIVFHRREVFERVNSWLCAAGCITEFSREFNLLAVSVPGSSDLTAIQYRLAAEAKRGSIGYEEPILRQ